MIAVGAEASLPSWEQLDAEHGRVGILRDHSRAERRERHERRAKERRDRYYLRWFGYKYEEYQARQDAAYRRRIARAEADVACRVAILKRSAAVKEMRANHPGILSAWLEVTLQPDGVVCRRAQADYERAKATTETNDARDNKCATE